MCVCVWFSHDIDFRTWNTVILGGLWGLCNLNRYMRNGSYSHTSYDNCPIWMDGELNRRVGGFLTHGHMTRCLQTRVPSSTKHTPHTRALQIPCSKRGHSSMSCDLKIPFNHSEKKSSSSSSSSSSSFNESHHARTSLFGLKAFHFLALAGLKCKHRDSH